MARRVVYTTTGRVAKRLTDEDWLSIAKLLYFDRLSTRKIAVRWGIHHSVVADFRHTPKYESLVLAMNRGNLPNKLKVRKGQPLDVDNLPAHTPERMIKNGTKPRDVDLFNALHLIRENLEEIMQVALSDGNLMAAIGAAKVSLDCIKDLINYKDKYFPEPKPDTSVSQYKRFADTLSLMTGVDVPEAEYEVIQESE